MPDLNAIRAYLDPQHHPIAKRLVEFAKTSVRPLPHPGNDDEGRRQARELLKMMGDTGWILSPIAENDLRTLALTREVLGSASPLADDIFAIQALAGTPIMTHGTPEAKARWVPAILSGTAMAAFAMTEPDAGSDVASMKTRAVPDGDGQYSMAGKKTYISNAHF